MTAITHGLNKVALNSTTNFALLVECANTYDFTEFRLNWNDGRGEKDWMMKLHCNHFKAYMATMYQFFVIR